jgi:hypothetical protein
MNSQHEEDRKRVASIQNLYGRDPLRLASAVQILAFTEPFGCRGVRRLIYFHDAIHVPGPEKPGIASDRRRRFSCTQLEASSGGREVIICILFFLK